jgi:DNA helicase II / ATP-dependent DNA helicase PcrA
MNDVIEVSYTGDLLAHRRCPRAWAYEKYVGFHPYEQVQAMEGRLIHHAMEWLTSHLRERGRHATRAELDEQVRRHFRVLWARGIRTGFASKEETIQRVVENLFPRGAMHRTVRAAIEGAVHTEYELRTVRKLFRNQFAGKGKLLLTGILDLVVQQQSALSYPNTWQWTDVTKLEGEPRPGITAANPGDLEIWDYKGTQASTPYMIDYVRQLLTYAALYHERTGQFPRRCVLFFVNEPDSKRQLLAVPVDPSLVQRALDWTIDQVRGLRQTVLDFERDPLQVNGGDLTQVGRPVGQRVTPELKKQCTACSFRCDCAEYRAHLRNPNHPDVSVTNVQKN